MNKNTSITTTDSSNSHTTDDNRSNSTNHNIYNSWSPTAPPSAEYPGLLRRQPRRLPRAPRRVL